MFDRSAKIAFLAVCVILLGSRLALGYAVSAMNAFLRKSPVNMREPFELIPIQIGRWTSITKDELLPVEMVEELGTDKYLNRAYAINGDPEQGVVAVHLAYYTGMIDAVPHVPDRCLIAGGYEFREAPVNMPLTIDQAHWKPSDQLKTRGGEPYLVYEFRDPYSYAYHKVVMPLGDVQLRVTEFQDTERPEMRIFGGYLFIANGRVTATPEGVRMMAFNLRERHAYYCKVQFNYQERDGTREEFLGHVSDLLSGLLPEVMECLPEWPEIERLDAGAADAVSAAPKS